MHHGREQKVHNCAVLRGAGGRKQLRKLNQPSGAAPGHNHLKADREGSAPATLMVSYSTLRQALLGNQVLQQEQEFPAYSSSSLGLNSSMICFWMFGGTCS